MPFSRNNDDPANAMPVWYAPGPPGTAPGRVSPVYNDATTVEVTTSATGANWVSLSSISCLAVRISNNTGVTLEFRVGSGAGVPIFDQSYYQVDGINNSNQISVRRVDQSNTQVTASALVLSNF